jgi:hypothetical protein
MITLVCSGSEQEIFLDRAIAFWVNSLAGAIANLFTHGCVELGS